MNIITVQGFLDSGLKVSSDITDKEITMAIQTVEQFYTKNALTQAHYNDLLNNPSTEPNRTLLRGGTIDGITYAGIMQAEYQLTYAYLLTENMRITRYSTIEKNSEFSKNSDREDILQQARVHWDIGEAFVKEVMKYYGLDTTHNKENNLFNTILW